MCIPQPFIASRKKTNCMVSKLGRDWRFNLEEIDKLRFAQECLGVPKTPRISMPAAQGGFSPMAQTMSSEASLVKVNAQKASIKQDDSPQRTFTKAHPNEAEIGATCTDVGQAPENCNSTVADSPTPYTGWEESELSNLRPLEKENRRLKEIVADQAPRYPKAQMDIGKNPQ
jgi:hypothetical protein